jgi:hypothetical protein
MAEQNPLPVIAEAERSPLVEQLLAQVERLLEENRRQGELIQQLRDEVAVLKGEKAKPKFQPSGMEQQTEARAPDDEAEAGDGSGGPPKRPGSAKRRKSAQLIIHETVAVAPSQPVPAGARFKGYRDFVVQDLRIGAHATRYRLEVWQTPEGERLVGALPASLQGGHFGPELRRYVLYQHHHCQVTQPLLHEQLREWGIDISVGQIDALLSGHTGAFLAEKDQVLTTALAVSRWITVDDSGARHQGRNGYVTQIGNDWFAWFASTASKSRINFLQLLQAGEIRYTVNAHALEYWREEGLPAAPRQHLQSHTLTTLVGTAAWDAHLDALGIVSERHRRIATVARPAGWADRERLRSGSGHHQRRGRTVRHPAPCPVLGARRAAGAQAHPPQCAAPRRSGAGARGDLGPLRRPQGLSAQPRSGPAARPGDAL